MQLPSVPFRRLIEFNSDPVTVYRRDDTTSGQYGSSITYTELSEPRDVFVMGIGEAKQATDAGERQATRLIVYTVGDVDLQENDRIDHGGNRFEAETRIPQPNGAHKTLYRFEFEHVD